MNTLASKVRVEFGDILQVSVGGQTSVDIFPKGWDKTYCLQFITNDYSDILFFGDKCYPGGNDYEIFMHERTKGYWVKNGPEEVIQLLEEIYTKY